MTNHEDFELQVHRALQNCDYKCEGILGKDIIQRTIDYCPEKHGEHAKNYKGRVILLPFKSRKKDEPLKMLCWKCLQKAEEEKRIKRKKRSRKAHSSQINAFDVEPDQKYPGPDNVPETSKLAYDDSRKFSGGMEKKAYNLVRKSPNSTAWELFSKSIDFKDIYDLRRCLSSLKKGSRIFNPSERTCSIKNRKTFTWRIV